MKAPVRLVSCVNPSKENTLKLTFDTVRIRQLNVYPLPPDGKYASRKTKSSLVPVVGGASSVTTVSGIEI